MTQYTKFTKNLAYNENYTTVNNSSNLNKSSNHMHFQSMSKNSAKNGPTSLGANSSLPKPVLVTNLNSSNIGNLIKNERIKSSALARSVTMRYNTNTKHQFENGTFANGLIQPASANQTNHFHYRNKNSAGNQQQQSQQTPTSPQQQMVSDAASQSKKEYLNLLSNIHRSSSIKINREKSNLSNYFSTLVQNKERGLANSSTNLSSNNYYNQNPNSASNGHINNLNHNSSHLKNIRKAQPFSLRNNNINNIFNANNSSLSNNNISSDNSNAFLYNTNANTIVNSNSLQHKKTSISLDNVYNGLDSLISSNENNMNGNNRYNINHKYDLNKSNLATNSTMTPTNNRKLISTTNTASFNNLHGNQLRSSVTPTTNNLNESEINKQRKRFSRMDTEDEGDQNENNFYKDQPSSRLNINNKVIEEHPNSHTNGEDAEETEQTGIKKIEITPKGDSRLSSNKKSRQRKENDAYNSKISKFDVIDQLDAQKVLPNGHEYMKVHKTKQALHAHSPPKTVSQNSYHSNAQIQKINGNNLQLITDKNIIDLQSRSNNNTKPVLRSQSVLSHITRDINDSYAYTNVQQYIEENDLMSPEKAQSIKKWVKEVNSNFDDWEKKTIEKHIEDLFI